MSTRTYTGTAICALTHILVENAHIDGLPRKTVGITRGEPKTRRGEDQ